MASDRFYISAFAKNSGLYNAVKPFAVPDKAFAVLNNAYVWRDRVRKRFGSRWLGNTQLETRLRLNLGEYNVQVGTTNGGGDLSGTVPGVTFNVGQRFVIGVETDTVTSALAGAQPMTMTGGTSTTHTFNIGTGAFVLVGAPANTPVYFFFNTATTSGAGAAAGVVPGVKFQIGQMFSIGTTIFTVWQNGALKNNGDPTNIGTTSSVGAAAGIVPGAVGAIGQYFLINGVRFNVTLANGALTTAGPGSGTFNTATGAYTFTGVSANSIITFFPSLSTGTYNLTTGAYSITGAPINTAVYFYPAQPVMGLITFETQTINDEQTIAFDTQFAYQYINGWERIAAENAPGDAIWTGSDSQFFWGASYGGVSPSDYTLYVTNFNENEPNYMRTLFGVTWSSFRPTVALMGTGSALDIYLDSARLLVPFKNRLLAFNTWETEDDGVNPPVQIHYPFRVRYSIQNADPDDQVNNWREDIPGLGGGLDATILEAIITVEFIRDRLIVFFERSTWELVYTNDDVDPFLWQQINTELGAESTFSVIPQDLYAYGVGNVGIIACTGTQVDRIDNNIPDEVFKIHNDNNGVERVYGIRDYYPELVYWTMPDPTASTTFPYPKKVLVYNYKNGTWSFNDDSITAFGYFQPVNSVTWDSEEVTWDDEEQWDDGSIQAQFRSVIAGNQQGWTFLIDTEAWTNAPALQITNITTPIPGVNIIQVNCINFNLESGDYIYLSGITGTTNMSLLNGTIQQVEIDLTDNIDFSFIVGDDSIPPITGTYTGGGMISRVSEIEIQTKAFNFYQQKGRNAAINKVDFLVDRTTKGQILIDWYVSNSTNTMVRQSQKVTGTGVLLGTSVLETFPYPSVPLEASQSQLWHPVYISANGEYVQLYLHMNNEQMRDNAVRISDFQLHAMVFTTTPTSRLQ